MRITEQVHSYYASVLHAGDLVIDATAGNGYDSLFIAKNILPSGNLFIFDLQKQAIDATQKRLTQAGFTDSCFTYLGSHAQMSTFLPTAVLGKIDHIFFNFGYLPGGDKRITTKKDSSIAALEEASTILKQNGTLSLLVYPGHPEGEKEAEAIEAWLESEKQSQRIAFEKIVANVDYPHSPFWIKARKE